MRTISNPRLKGKSVMLGCTQIDFDNSGIAEVEDLVAESILRLNNYSEVVTKTEEKVDTPPEETKEVDLSQLGFVALKKYAAEHGIPRDKLKLLKSKATVLDEIAKLKK